MLKRCLILESTRHSRLIQIIGIILILVRFADWPYELTFHNIQAQMEQPIESGQTCWATWYVLGPPMSREEGYWDSPVNYSIFF